MTNLRLNKELFALEPITAALSAYQSIAKIELSEDSNYWQCCFTACKYGEEQTALEFENYLIDLMNCKTR